jgi:hypothetical protein
MHKEEKLVLYSLDCIDLFASNILSQKYQQLLKEFQFWTGAKKSLPQVNH